MKFQDQVSQRKLNCSDDVRVSHEAASMLLIKMREKRDSSEGVSKAQRQTIKSLGSAFNYSPSRWDIHQRIENAAAKILH